MAKQQKKSNPLVNGYLVLYNLASCLGWGYVLYICALHIKEQNLATLYNEVELPLKIVQTAACMEILHSMVGMVKSPWFTTAMQVFSRVWTLWAVMHVAPPAQTSIWMLLACTSWALVEVPRYLFYALNIMDAVPYPLFWLRYSLFAVLYPTGISGELGCMYMAGTYLYGTKLYTIAPIESMPQVEISLFLAIVLVALTYIPGSPTMYGHMVKTRKKQMKEYKEKAKQM
jgi:very-long-chain (3R)-3-hydroxyacyl-CoA dehydratase